MPVRRPCCLQHERLEQIRMPQLVFCTLLGPEGPGRGDSSNRALAIGPLDLVVTGLRFRRTGYRPYFENYTVDASILDSNRKVRIT
jgi:hypothetical protein